MRKTSSPASRCGVEAAPTVVARRTPTCVWRVRVTVIMMISVLEYFSVVRTTVPHSLVVTGIQKMIAVRGDVPLTDLVLRF